MAEEKKKKTVRKNNSSKIQSNELSNEELLEQILTKSKKKKTNKKKSSSSNGSSLKNDTTKESLKVNDDKNNSLSNENGNSLSANSLKESSSSSKSSKKELTNDELLDQILNKKNGNDNKKDLEVKIELPALAKSKSTVNEEKSNIDSENIVSDGKAVDNPNDKKNDVVGKSKHKKDLIITREINYDRDVFDLNNKNALKELRDAIEEFDRLEKQSEQIEKAIDSEKNDKIFEEFAQRTKYEKIDEQSDDRKRSDRYQNDTSDSYLTGNYYRKVDDVKPNKNELKYDNNDKQRFILIVVCSILVILLILILGFYCVLSSFSENEESVDLLSSSSAEIDDETLTQQYNSCLNSLYDGNLDDDTAALINELEEYLSKEYNVSIMYEDLKSGFSFSYNADTVYYAASTIKTLDALYIYTKAAEGEIDLDEELTYTSKYKWSSSKELGNYSYGTKISLRNLVKYSITVSDNSAHQMLVDYIGKSNLKDFGLSLGATNTLSGGDNFGNIDVSDAIVYLKALNQFINENDELGEELKSYFIDSEQNDLSASLDNIFVATKYGQYNEYYHNIGIVYDDNPYVIAVLSTEGKNDYEAVISDISERVYEIHKAYNEIKTNNCKLEIYGS